jgi:hypothetical protein
VLQAINGNVEAKPDDIYAKTVHTKTSAIDYAFYRAIHNSIYGVKFEFEVSLAQALGDCMTTATSIKGFLTLALNWEPAMTRMQLDTQAKDALKWLNALVKEMAQIKEFDKRQHMAQQPLRAYGELYRSFATAAASGGKAPESYISDLAKKIVSLGNIGRGKKNEIVAKLSK